jgi:hypothetical protein
VCVCVCVCIIGKYEQSNHIEPHDDRAYTEVVVEGNTKVN